MNHSDIGLDLALSNKFGDEGSLTIKSVLEPDPQLVRHELREGDVIIDNSPNNVQTNEGLINWNVSPSNTEMEAVKITSTSTQAKEGADSDTCSKMMDIMKNQDSRLLSMPSSENNHGPDSLQIGKLTLIDTSLTDSTIDGLCIKSLNDTAALNFHKGQLKMNSTCSLDLDAEKASQSSATEESVSDIGLSSESLSSYNKGSSDIFEVPTPYDIHEVEKYKDEVFQLKQVIDR